jgi:uncharacterized membrane protein
MNKQAASKATWDVLWVLSILSLVVGVFVAIMVVGTLLSMLSPFAPFIFGTILFLVVVWLSFYWANS